MEPVAVTGSLLSKEQDEEIEKFIGGSTIAEGLKSPVIAHCKKNGFTKGTLLAMAEGALQKQFPDYPAVVDSLKALQAQPAGQSLCFLLFLPCFPPFSLSSLSSPLPVSSGHGGSHKRKADEGPELGMSQLCCCIVALIRLF